jgi:hypothetical protein
MTTSVSLTESEQVKLRDLEGIIERGLQTFVEVGAALTLIREQGLYRTLHPTFDEYCKERWGWSDRRARQLMEASEVVGTLAETGTMVPTNERQAREVAAVPEEKRAEVWEKAVKSAPKHRDGTPKVTAKHVRQAAASVIPIRTNKNGSIDKLGSLRATREAAAENGSTIDVRSETKNAKAEVARSPWGRLSDYLAGLTNTVPPKLSREEIREAVTGDTDAGWFKTARMVRDYLNMVLEEHDTAKEAEAHATR